MMAYELLLWVQVLNLTCATYATITAVENLLESMELKTLGLALTVEPLNSKHAFL